MTLEDELTGLYNRRGFLTLAERHLKLAVRRKIGLLLLFCDVDGLKVINDTYGHAAGDRAINAAGDLLRRSFRARISSRGSGATSSRSSRSRPLGTVHSS